MEKISFTSRIRLVPMSEFKRAINGISVKNSVKYPWTIKESVLSDSAYTTNILDCTVCGLTDGQKVLLTHICPTNPKNNDFSSIEKFIKEKIDLGNEYLQGFVIGSKSGEKQSAQSSNLFSSFIELLKKHNIPFSQFKESKSANNIMYSSIKDEWVIGNDNVVKQLEENPKNPIEVLKRIFEVVKISDLDSLSW